MLFVSAENTDTTTQWESQINSVQAIRYQTTQIRAALLDVERCSPNDPNGVSDGQSLVTKLENFEFYVVWLFGTIFYFL
jgi:hypothetical protein